LPPRASLVAGVLAFVLPLLAWCIVSYVPFVWHPLVHVRDASDVNVPGEYSYVAGVGRCVLGVVGGGARGSIS
jgi:hypothetical protein